MKAPTMEHKTVKHAWYLYLMITHVTPLCSVYHASWFHPDGAVYFGSCLLKYRATNPAFGLRVTSTRGAKKMVPTGSIKNVVKYRSRDCIRHSM